MDLIKHPEFGEIRTVMRGKEPWFVNQDVCDILGLKRTDRIASGFLDEDEKVLQKMDTPGGVQEMVLINESGLYTLIMRSNKPAAKKFRKWVTSEVLPAIRRNGYYIHPELVDRKEERRIRKQLAAGVLKYLTDENLRNVAKKFGVSRYAVKYAVEGTKSDNAIMQECQRLALLNKEKELNAYHPKRMLEVINKLNR